MFLSVKNSISPCSAVPLSKKKIGYRGHWTLLNLAKNKRVASIRRLHRPCSGKQAEALNEKGHQTASGQMGEESKESFRIQHQRGR